MDGERERQRERERYQNFKFTILLGLGCSAWDLGKLRVQGMMVPRGAAINQSEGFPGAEAQAAAEAIIKRKLMEWAEKAGLNGVPHCKCNYDL